MVSHWSLSDSMSPQVSRTLLSILANLNTAVVWMVSIRPLISKSSGPSTNTLVTVPRAPITIGIIVTLVFRSFFNYLARSMYFSLFSHSYNFILRSAGVQSPHFGKFPFYVYYYYYYYYYHLLIRVFHISVS